MNEIKKTPNILIKINICDFIMNTIKLTILDYFSHF
jgi:hypothetical protein